jgi:site-specific recombinase XerD
LRAGNSQLRLREAINANGGLRVSELVSLTWAQVIQRDSGEAQLSIVGKGSKSREVLIPAVIAARLFASSGEALASAPVFQSVRRPGGPLTERAVNFIVKEAAERAGVNPAASIHWLRHAHASHAIAITTTPRVHEAIKQRVLGGSYCRSKVSNGGRQSLHGDLRGLLS